MIQRNNFIGLDGFVWFIGVVENRDDPLKLGRVQARIFGWHTDKKNEIPTLDLPWAQPVLSPNNSSQFSAPKEGDMIVGFFTDGPSAQAPIYIGVLPGIPENRLPEGSGFSDARNKTTLESSPLKPYSRSLSNEGVKLSLYDKTRYPRERDWNQPTTSRLARNEDTANTVYQFRKTNWIQADSTNGTKWKEPYPAYNAQYPFNSVNESESGHIFEMDDTFANERVMLAHRTGTTMEMYPSGTKVDKIVKDNYSIVHGSDFCYIKGKAEITVENVAKIRIKGHTVIEIDSDLDFRVAGNMNLSVGKNLNIQTGQNLNYNISSSINEVAGGNKRTNVGGTFDVLASKQIALDGSTTNLNSGVARAAQKVTIKEPNAYQDPKEVVPVPEQVKNVNYTGQLDIKTAPIPANVAIVTVVTEPTQPEVTEEPPVPVESTGECFTIAMLKATSSKSAEGNLQIYVNTFNKVCETYAFTNNLRKSHFLSQCSHESAGFGVIEENLNYSSEGLRRIFPKYFPNDTIANEYARQPEKIANRVYAGRMGNGPESSGDGWKYHGRGLIQLTGKENYTRFANAMKMSLDDVVSYLSTPEGAAMSAAWYWNSRAINTQADANNIQAVTRKVNGGLIGLDDRIVKFEKTLKVMT
jgi:putative chitinase